MLLAAFGATYVDAASGKLQEAYQFYQAHRFKEAVAAFDEHLQKNPNDINALYYDALCNQQVGNMSRAKSLYRQVVQVNPKSQVASYAESILIKVDPNYHPVASSSASTSTTASADSSATAVSAASASGSGGSSPIQGPDQANVYYRERGNGKGIVVKVEINGRPVDMILDTGAPGICISKRELENIGVSAPIGDATGKTGGSSNADLVGTWDLKANVKVGPFLYPGADVLVMDSPDANALLGQTFVKNFEFQLDQSAHCIRFTKKGANSGPAGTKGYDIPFTFREGGNRIIVEGEINKRKGRYMMDTGNAGSGIAFHSPEQATAYGAAVPDDARIGTFTGVSGSGQSYVYTIKHFKIGPVDCSDLEVSANISKNGFRTEEPLLGFEVFQGWQYTVDYDKHVIHLLRR